MYDDGTNSDLTAGDGTYTARFTIETDDANGDCCDTITLSLSNVQAQFDTPPGPEEVTYNPPEEISFTISHDCGNDDTTSAVALEGMKFEDHNGNGVQDPEDQGLAGWHVTVWLDSNGNGNADDGETHDVVTGVGGSWNYGEDVLDSVLTGPGAAWTASEVQQTGWTQTYGNAGYAGVFVSEETRQFLDFGNFQNIDICGTKYEDHNGNGVQDSGDQALAGFTFQLSGDIVTNGGFENPNIPTNSWSVYNSITGWSTTSGSGIEVQDHVAGTPYEGGQHVELDSNSNSAMKQDLATTAGGVYTLSFAYSPRPGVASGSNGIEVFWNGVSIASITADGTGNGDTVWTVYQFQVTATGATSELKFAATGANDSLGGYLDAVSVKGVVATTTSDEDGEFCFTNIGPGAWTVTEATPALNWVQTQGEDGYSGTASSGVDVTNLVFGNTNVGTENGKTLGFWSNKNGQALITCADIASLNVLNLKKADGTDAVFTNAASVKSFLLSASATNMANMLSAQLASTQLNLNHHFFGSSTAIDVEGVITTWSGNSQGANLTNNLDNDGNTVSEVGGNVNQYGFASIQGLIDAANAELALHSTAYSSDAWRVYQEALKIAFDAMNNNLAIFAI
jgi:uncharacterized protein DUF642